VARRKISQFDDLLRIIAWSEDVASLDEQRDAGFDHGDQRARPPPSTSVTTAFFGAGSRIARFSALPPTMVSSTSTISSAPPSGPVEAGAVSHTASRMRRARACVHIEPEIISPEFWRTAVLNSGLFLNIRRICARVSLLYRTSFLTR